MSFSPPSYPLKYHYQIVLTIVALLGIGVFITGIHYFTILAYSFFLLMRASCGAVKPKFLKEFNMDLSEPFSITCPYAMIPVFLYAIRADVMELGIRPSLLVVVSSFVAFEVLIALVTETTSGWIATLQNHEVFIVCPACQFRHYEITRACERCSYSKAEPLPHKEKILSYQAKESLREEIARYKKIGLFTTPSAKLIRLMGLKQGETVLINYKFSISQEFYQNGEIDKLKRMVISDRAIYFIDYFYLQKGWRFREIINLQDVTEIILANGMRYGKKELIFSIKTDNKLIDITWRPIINDHDEWKKRIKIFGIIDCIKLRKPAITFVSKVDYLHPPENPLDDIKLEW